MDTKEQAQMAQTPASPASRTRTGRALSRLLLIGGLLAGSAGLVVYSLSGSDPAPIKVPPKGAAWSYEEVFPHWNQKPDFVLVITGQTYGYLQKCGCSDPQKGGLERRFNFIEGLKAHGIEAIPLDLGDVPPEVTKDHKILHPQALLKYEVAMRAMKAMGYKAVGLGLQEFALGLGQVHGEFSAQQGNDRPRILAANLIGQKLGDSVISKKDVFPNGTGKDTAFGDWEIIPTKSKINVGVVGIVGDPIVTQVMGNPKNKVHGLDDTIVFASNAAKVLVDAEKQMDKLPNKPALKVLLYSGPFNLARNVVAPAYKDFGVIVCQSEEAEPHQAEMVNNDKTMILRIGHRGQNVGVVGVFKNPRGGFTLKYQHVTITPEFETPPGQEKANLALAELDRYAKEVKSRGYLTKNRREKHPLQVSNPDAKYVGSAICANCHKAGDDNTDAVWTASKHAAAYNALEHIATKPTGRQFDGECIRCHTVGYDYNSGFVDAVQSPQLMNVGCENCHGPGSLHSAAEVNNALAAPAKKAFAAQMSPWRETGKETMPDAAALKAYMEERDAAKRNLIIPPAQQTYMNSVDRTCQNCHNVENDPHFKFEAFWPKIAHSMKGLPKQNVAPKGDGPVVKEKDPKAPDAKELGPSLDGPGLPLPLPKP